MKTSGCRAGGARLGAAIATALGLAAAGGGAFAAATAPAASSQFYERAVMSAADQRCSLFSAQVGSALASARSQARGAALRAGAAAGQLDQLQALARQRAGAVACGSPDMRTAAARVRSAFEGYARLSRMSYPGDLAAWSAQRNVPQSGAGWILSQSARAGQDRTTFGLAAAHGQAAQLMAAALFADGATPYAARLVVRDLGRTSGPYLSDARGGPTARIALPRRMAPLSASRVFMAQARTRGADLSPVTGEPAVVFRFPDGAAQALSALDPREAVRVEFLFAGAGPDRTRTAYYELGDFAAGQAFLRLASR